MRKEYKKTGDFGLGSMIHTIHMSDDVNKLNDFYRNVLGGFAFMGIDELNFLPNEDRWASLLMVSSVCIETMAPNTPVNPNFPVGKFYSKFGQHLHSVGYAVDDLPGIAARMIEKGIYIGAPGGGKIEKLEEGTMYFYPSPRDTAGLMVELCAFEMSDPSSQDTWTELERLFAQHPMTYDRFNYITLGVRDLDAAINTYVDIMQAIPVAEGIDDEQGFKYMTVHIGDSLLQLAQPLEADSDLGKHVEKYGNFIYSLTWKIRDIDSAEKWLNSKGVRTTRPRANLLATNPEDSLDAPLFFTTEVLPGDPFEA
ncbi:MAG: hypothetical protein Q7K25_01300 [Actinomycetota bacterium]|nr:hypothetical protein [Actinomycetota bacterium]